MNDREREMWIQNNEGLYKWWKATKLSMKNFLLAHRSEVDHEIQGILKRHSQAKEKADGN